VALKVADGQPSSFRRRVRARGESRGRVASRRGTGGRCPCAAGQARAVGAPSASVRERGPRSRRMGLVVFNDPAGAVVDRRAASVGALAWADAERDGRGGGEAISRTRSRAAWRQGALRSSSWATGSSSARCWRRRTDLWCPSCTSGNAVRRSFATSAIHNRDAHCSRSLSRTVPESGEVEVGLLAEFRWRRSSTIAIVSRSMCCCTYANTEAHTFRSRWGNTNGESRLSCSGEVFVGSL
jgi:hypothetical protein